MSDPSDRQLRSQAGDNDSIQQESIPGTPAPAARRTGSIPPTPAVANPIAGLSAREVQDIRNFMAASAEASGSSVTPARDLLRSQTPAAAQAAPEIVSRPQIIAESDYKTTHQNTFEVVKANQISATSHDTKRKLIALSDAFRAADLLTLLDGSRLRPTCTLSNPNGFSPRSVMLNPTTLEYDIIRNDDIYHYKHDQVRLFTLVRIAFHMNMDYLCTEAMEAHDGITVFSIISKHLQGTMATDVEKARKALHENFAFNQDVLFQVEAVRLQSLVSDLNYAQGRPMEESELRSFLIKHMFYDKREYLRTTLLMCLKDNETYQQMIEALVAVSGTVSAIIASHQADPILSQLRSREVQARGQVQIRPPHRPKPQGPIPRIGDSQEGSTQDTLQLPTVATRRLNHRTPTREAHSNECGGILELPEREDHGTGIKARN